MHMLAGLDRPTVRPGRDRRRGDHRDGRPRADAAASQARRLRLPGVQPAADADGRGERRPAAVDRRREDRPALGRGGDRNASGSATAATIGPPSCRAVSSSASRLPGRSSPSRPCCSPTSRPATSTPAPAPRCWSCCATAVDSYGQTTLMVTHDAARPPSPTGSCSSPTASSSRTSTSRRERRTRRDEGAVMTTIASEASPSAACGRRSRRWRSCSACDGQRRATRSPTPCAAPPTRCRSVV